MSMKHISECLPALGGVLLRRSDAKTEGERVANQHRRSSDADFLAAARITINALCMDWKRHGYSSAEVQKFMNEFIEAAASRRTELAYTTHINQMEVRV